MLSPHFLQGVSIVCRDSARALFAGHDHLKQQASASRCSLAKDKSLVTEQQIPAQSKAYLLLWLELLSCGTFSPRWDRPTETNRLFIMTYFRYAFVMALLLAGCDAIGDPVATITGIDVTVAAPDHFIEIQDVAGRSYARVESFPASVDIRLYSEERTYFIVEIRRTDDGFQAVAASDSFIARDLTDDTFTTSGGVEAVLSLE